MYINDVIKRCDTLAPNEYTLGEKYLWCDELSAMLCQEYIKKYRKVTLEPDEKGEYILPEGITFEMADRVIAQGRELDKRDLRSFGIEPVYTRHERFYVSEPQRSAGAIDVVYLAQHTPIRDLKITVKLPTVGSDSIAAAEIGIEAGDTVNVTFTDADNEKINYASLPVLETSEGRLIFPQNTFSDIVSHGFTECVIERIVTEETVCPSPYDLMYIDYVLAQIAHGQRNYSVYNQHMLVFNEHLRSFHNWLMARRETDRDNQITNWW